MERTKVFILSTFLLVTYNSCIDRFYPEDQINFVPRLVIDGIITNAAKPQEIVISRASSTKDPAFIPYSGCTVDVVDDQDRVFRFEEAIDRPGVYFASIDNQYLAHGSQFQLSVITPQNRQYSSTFEEMTSSPPIDTAYYELTTLPTSDPDYFIDGLQFYLDFMASNKYGKNYLFGLEESYEYHSTWPIRSYIDETGFVSSPADYSRFICYQTQDLADIFLLSTSNLSENTYIKYPLNFVSDHTQRLLYNYSLKITQYSISESAYAYWETLQKNNQESDGLFAKQPATVKGNIYNIDDPEEIVLGYFGVSSITTRQLLLKHIDELSFNEVPYCKAIFPDAGLPVAPRPLYLVRVKNPKDPEGPLVWGYSGSECFDCTLLGGSVTKPDYFD